LVFTRATAWLASWAITKEVSTKLVLTEATNWVTIRPPIWSTAMELAQLVALIFGVMIDAKLVWFGPVWSCYYSFLAAFLYIIGIRGQLILGFRFLLRIDLSLWACWNVVFMTLLVFQVLLPLFFLRIEVLQYCINDPNG